jgi:LysM repeat protein
MKSTLVGIGLVAVAASMGMASCGESGDAALTNTTAIQLGATNYVTVPPTPSTDVAPTTTAAAQPEQEYIVQSGDYPSTIATRFNVPLQALMDVNGWRLEGQIAIGFPPAGTPIKIPAGGTVPAGATPTETTVAGATAADDATTVPTATAPVFPATPGKTIDAGCVSQEYTITASDTSRLRVADKFGVTVQALDAANAGTNGYSAFYPGLVIKIPASSTDNC